MFVRRNPRVAAAVGTLVENAPLLEDTLGAIFVGDAQQRYQRWIEEYDTLDDQAVAQLAEACARVVNDFSIISLLPGTDAVAEVGLAEHEFVVFVDPRVTVRPHALSLIRQRIVEQPSALLIYGDDDVAFDDGTRRDHYFKPDWNPALLRSQNYVGGLVAVRRSVAAQVVERVPSSVVDWLWHFLLELAVDVPEGSVHHIPHVLSHWREERLAYGHDPAGRLRAGRALEQRLASMGEAAKVEAVGKGSYLSRYSLPKIPPLVSILVPTMCNLEFLRPCVDGILERTSYPQIELVLVANGARYSQPEESRYLAMLGRRGNVRVLFDDQRPYNFAAINNRAVDQACGSIICFLNDDTEVLHDDWLSEMVARVLQNRVAAVGAKLLYPNGRVQHAGVILGVGYVAGHAYARKRADIAGYHDRALVDQDLSSVTAACMVIRRDVFSEVGGFDESFAIAHNDIDLCLRLRRKGWRVVWTPAAQLVHRESTSIGRHDSQERQKEWTYELTEMRRRWADVLRSDPHYNPNLSLDAVELWEPAFPPRVAYAWRPNPGSAKPEDPTRETSRLA